MIMNSIDQFINFIYNEIFSLTLNNERNIDYNHLFNKYKYLIYEESGMDHKDVKEVIEQILQKAKEELTLQNDVNDSLTKVLKMPTVKTFYILENLRYDLYQKSCSCYAKCLTYKENTDNINVICKKC